MASSATPRSFPPTQAPAPFFPLARYTSLVGVHTSLLLFTGLFLPRTSLSAFLQSFITGTYTPTPTFDHVSPFDSTSGQPQTGQVRSADRPEHPFLTAITRDPATTLGWLCAGVAVLQVWWAAWLKTWLEDYRLSLLTEEMRAQEKERLREMRAVGTFGPGGKGRRVAEAGLWTVMMAGALHVVAVLFGAPLASHGTTTGLLALLVALLTCFAPAYVLLPPVAPIVLLSSLVPSLSTNLKSSSNDGLNRRLTWIRLFVEFSPQTPVETALVYPFVAALFGAWLGVIPLALDWDRPWQAWPLPSAYLALVGSVLGSLAACAVSSIRHFAALGRAHAAAASDARSERQYVEERTETRAGAVAVEEMRKNVQAVFDGLGGGEGKAKKGKKKVVVKRTGD